MPLSAGDTVIRSMALFKLALCLWSVVFIILNPKEWEDVPLLLLLKMITALLGIDAIVSFAFNIYFEKSRGRRGMCKSLDKIFALIIFLLEAFVVIAMFGNFFSPKNNWEK